jgi:hypothetical protein
LASYLNTIERYHEYRGMIRELMQSILTGLADIRLFEDSDKVHEALEALFNHYPFMDLVYTLDVDGRQDSANFNFRDNRFRIDPSSQGRDRSQRPYYLLARETQGIAFTEPYLSNKDRVLCLSGAMPLRCGDNMICGYLVIDLDLDETIRFLMGDNLRTRFESAFKAIYTLIAIGLFMVVAILLYSGFSELVTMLEEHSAVASIRPFSAIIFITLGLAIFDLAKTTLEEEVLMHKDIFRHSSTRRTITRFMAAILIAVSIEALLLMFKSALGNGEQLLHATLMLLAAVALMVGLGAYVYLGALAERTLQLAKREQLEELCKRSKESLEA